MLSLVCAVAIKQYVLGCVRVVKPLSHNTMGTPLQTIDPMMQAHWQARRPQDSPAQWQEGGQASSEKKKWMSRTVFGRPSQ